MVKIDPSLFKKRVLVVPLTMALLLLFCMFTMFAIEIVPPGGSGPGDDTDTDGDDNWITIEGYIEDYDPQFPDTIGNPGEVVVSGEEDSTTTVEFDDDCFEEHGSMGPPYYWFLCIQVDNATGAAGDFTFIEGGDILFYNFDDDEWIGTFTWTSGVWNFGDPPLAITEEVYVPFPEGYHIRIWFQICDWDMGHPWDVPGPGLKLIGCCSHHYIDFEVPEDWGE